jgi:hypothetical protein
MNSAAARERARIERGGVGLRRRCGRAGRDHDNRYEPGGEHRACLHEPTPCAPSFYRFLGQLAEPEAESPQHHYSFSSVSDEELNTQAGKST